MSPDREDGPPPCSCIDLSPVAEAAATGASNGTPAAPAAPGAFLGANLTFSQSNLHENNNNLPAPEKQATTNGSLLRWRWKPNGTSQAGDPTDVKDVRKTSSASARTTRRSSFVEGCSEFFATFLLMFMGCAGSFISTDAVAGTIFGSVGFGLAVFMATTIFGELSGPHMNPLVTLLNVAVGNLRWTRAVVYIIGQAGGAILGYGLLLVVIPSDVSDAVKGASSTGAVCCTVPMSTMPSWAAILAEFLVTSILLSAVCAGINTKPPHTAPPAFQFGILVTGICILEVVRPPDHRTRLRNMLKITLSCCIFGVAFWKAKYTGASMNPTRSLATAVWTGVWDRFWVFLVGQALSMAFVIGVYLFFRQPPQED